MRPQVARFAELMEQTLAKHDATKGPTGWRTMRFVDLVRKWGDEVDELVVATSRYNSTGANAQAIVDAAVDVANLCMMLADWVSGGEQHITDIANAGSNERSDNDEQQ